MSHSRRAGPALLAHLVLFATAATGPVWGSEISGRIHITRRLSMKRVSITSNTYQRGMAVDPGNTLSDDAEMARVAIYLDGGPKTNSEAGPVGSTDPAAKLEQKGRRFEPEVVIVPVGASVAFPNFDPIVHNVFSLSKSKSFDLGYYPQGQSRTIRFDHPGIVPVYCHLHPNMSAAIVVAPSPWMAMPNAAGAFQLTGIAPGAYTLVVWHKSAGFFRRKVTIEAGKRVLADVEIPVRELTEEAASK